MPQPVAAIIPRPPRYGLVAACREVSTVDERWVPLGFVTNPEGCGVGGVKAVDCMGQVSAMTPVGGPQVNHGEPFAVYASDTCSALAYGARDFEGRARRQLELVRSYQIALEFWDGALTTADGLDNRVLTDPASDTVTSGPAHPVDALACLEQAMAVEGRGRQGMIHITPQLLTQYASHYNIATLVGNTWFSPNGHVIVPDAGYSGNGPGGVAAGSSQWIYGTDVIGLRLGEVFTTPSTLDDARNLAASMNHGRNDIVVFAEQAAA